MGETYRKRGQNPCELWGRKKKRQECFDNGICILRPGFHIIKTVKYVLGNNLSAFRYKNNIVNFALLRGYEGIKIFHHIHSILHMTHIDIQILAVG